MHEIRPETGNAPQNEASGLQATLKVGSGTTYVGKCSNPTSKEQQKLLVPTDELSTEHTRAKNDSGSPSRKLETQGALLALTGRHKEIMRRLTEGSSLTRITELMGISNDALTLITRSPMFREELGKMLEKKAFEVGERLEDLSNEALDEIRNLMRSAKTEAIRKSSAESILDRAGYGKVERKVVYAVTGEEVIKELNRRNAERAKVIETEANA